MIDWSIIVAVISSAVAVASWATSASKSRVNNLCQIIDAQERRIVNLEADLATSEGRIESLEADLAEAEGRIDELEDENRFYRRVIDAEGIDLCRHEQGKYSEGKKD